MESPSIIGLFPLPTPLGLDTATYSSRLSVGIDNESDLRIGYSYVIPNGNIGRHCGWNDGWWFLVSKNPTLHADKTQITPVPYTRCSTFPKKHTHSVTHTNHLVRDRIIDKIKERRGWLHRTIIILNVACF